MKKKRKSVSYAKWGYIFILPFFNMFSDFFFDSSDRYSQI